jgi:hypothetical protein
MTRPALAAVPVLVSDRTCEAILGTPWRGLRSFCHENKIPIGRIGRRPVVAIAAVVAALEGVARKSTYDEAAVIELAARRVAR